MYRELLTVLGVWVSIELSGSQKISVLKHEEGDSVTLSCSLDGSYTFPAWSGPPSFLPYTIINDATREINSAAPAVDRLSYASNDQDLILNPAFVNDSGEYKCSYSGLGDHTITLNVTEKKTTTPPPETNTTEEPCSWWCILLIGIGGLYLCGIVIGIFMYCCKDEPWNKINVEDKTYWWIFLLIIVIAGLGILTVYLICKVCGRFNAKNESEPDAMQEKMKMAEDLASHGQDKNAL